MADAHAPALIYHVLTLTDWRVCWQDDGYVPARFALDGFVHCTGDRALTLRVANDYFHDARDAVIVLMIDSTRLTAPLRWEPPAPLAGGGATHLAGSDLFPHVYGPINRAAIVGVGAFGRAGADFRWPTAFATRGATEGAGAPANPSTPATDDTRGGPV